MPRLPQRITILGYTLRIKSVGKRKLAEIFEDEEDAGSFEGAWIQSERTIYILRTLSYKKKREAVLHELQHALVDLKEWG